MAQDLLGKVVYVKHGAYTGIITEASGDQDDDQDILVESISHGDFGTDVRQEWVSTEAVSEATDEQIKEYRESARMLFETALHHLGEQRSVEVLQNATSALLHVMSTEPGVGIFR